MEKPENAGEKKAPIERNPNAIIIVAVYAECMNPYLTQ